MSELLIPLFEMIQPIKNVLSDRANQSQRNQTLLFGNKKN